MSGSEQQRQWADHLRDEAAARQVQQRSAGSTHAPVDGPVPYSADQLADAIAAAVAAERLRCAEIADSWGAEPRLLQAFGDFTEWELRAASATARAVAGEIRGHATAAR